MKGIQLPFSPTVLLKMTKKEVNRKSDEMDVYSDEEDEQSDSIDFYSELERIEQGHIDFEAVMEDMKTLFDDVCQKKNELMAIVSSTNVSDDLPKVSSTFQSVSGEAAALQSLKLQKSANAVSNYILAADTSKVPSQKPVLSNAASNASRADKETATNSAGIIKVPAQGLDLSLGALSIGTSSFKTTGATEQDLQRPEDLSNGVESASASRELLPIPDFLLSGRANRTSPLKSGATRRALLSIPDFLLKGCPPKNPSTLKPVGTSLLPSQRSAFSTDILSKEQPTFQSDGVQPSKPDAFSNGASALNSTGPSRELLPIPDFLFKSAANSRALLPIPDFLLNSRPNSAGSGRLPTQMQDYTLGALFNGESALNFAGASKVTPQNQDILFSARDFNREPLQLPDFLKDVRSNRSSTNSSPVLSENSTFSSYRGYSNGGAAFLSPNDQRASLQSPNFSSGASSNGSSTVYPLYFTPKAFLNESTEAHSKRKVVNEDRNLMEMPESDDDAYEVKYEVGEEEDDEDKFVCYPRLSPDNPNMVTIGPYGTDIDLQVFESIIWNCPADATRFLLSLLFSEETLATHTLTGLPSPAFSGRENECMKYQLDLRKVEDIVHCIDIKSCGDENDTRAVITTKCADLAKLYKRHEERWVELNRPVPVRPQFAYYEDISQD